MGRQENHRNGYSGDGMIPPKPPIKMDYLPEILGKLINLIRPLIDNKFYGTLEIKFEAGKIVLCRKDETIKF